MPGGQGRAEPTGCHPGLGALPCPRLPPPPRQYRGHRGQPPRPGARGQAEKGHPGLTSRSPPRCASAATGARTDRRAHGRTDARTPPLSPRPAGSPSPSCSLPPAAAAPGRAGHAVCPYLSGCPGHRQRSPRSPARQRAAGLCYYSEEPRLSAVAIETGCASERHRRVAGGRREPGGGVG